MIAFPKHLREERRIFELWVHFRVWSRVPGYKIIELTLKNLVPKTDYSTER